MLGWLCCEFLKGYSEEEPAVPAALAERWAFTGLFLGFRSRRELGLAQDLPR